MTNRYCSECNHLICPGCILLDDGTMICSNCYKKTDWTYVPNVADKSEDSKLPVQKKGSLMKEQMYLRFSRRI